jgi:hypothetical protein
MHEAVGAEGSGNVHPALVAARVAAAQHQATATAAQVCVRFMWGLSREVTALALLDNGPLLDESEIGARIRTCRRRAAVSAGR